MFSKLWKDPVWSKVIASAIVAAGAAVLASIKGWWPAIGAGIARGWQWLGDSSAIAHWLLIVLGLCAAAVAITLVAVAWGYLNSKGTDTPGGGWRKYTTDEFLGLKWRWGYAADGAIVGASAFCSRCDYQIRPVVERTYSGDSETTFPCDECHHSVGPLEGSYYDIESQVERRVQQRIRNGTWPGNEA